MKNKGAITGSILGVLLIVMAVLAFVILPILPDGNAPTGLRVLAKWDSTEITNESDSRFYDEFEQLQYWLGEPQNNQQELEFANVAADAAIIDVAMETEMTKIGYNPSENLINKTLINQFRDSDGNVSKELYDSQSASELNTLRQDVINSLKRATYIQNMLGYSDGTYGLKMSDAEKAFIEELATETKTFEYISFGVQDFPQEEVRKYGEENAELFVKYDFTVVSFAEEPAAKTVSQAILKANTTFDDAFASRDTNVINSRIDSNGKFLMPYRKDINRMFPHAEDLQKVISLKVGEVSEPIALGSIYVLIRCDAEPVQPDFEDSELLSTVSLYMREYQMGMIEDYLVARAGEFKARAEETSFEVATREFQKDTIISDPVSLNYGDSQFLPQIAQSNNSSFRGAINNEKFYQLVKGAKDDDVLEPILINDTVFVFRHLRTEQQSEEFIQDAVDQFVQTNRAWNSYYILSLLGVYGTVPLAQDSVITGFLTSPKAQNNVY